MKLSPSKICRRHIAVLSLAALTVAAAPASSGETTEDTSTTTVEETSTPDGTSTEEAESTSGPSGETSTSDAESETAAAAEEDAPDASATAVEVEDVIVISQATASQDSASATVLELGGERVVGGDADGGSSSGAVIDTEETELGRLAVGPWSATTDGNSSSSQASAAEVTVIDGDTFYAHVLRSRAAANGDGGTDASSDAVVLGIGGEDEVRVLSSVWTSDGPDSALIRQGDDAIGQDSDGACQVEVPSVLHLLCLTGSDGMGGTLVPGENEDAEYASVAEAEALEELGVAAVRAGGDEGSGAVEVPADDTSDDTAESPAPGDDRELAAVPDTDDSSLPVTGGGLTVLAVALLALATGLVLRRRAASTA